MAYENLRKEIAKLGETVPHEYQTFDADRKVVINSPLPSLAWYEWATELLGSRGREAEKRALREQLENSEGLDSCGGHLYELIAAVFNGPVECGGVPTPPLQAGL